MNMYKIKSLGSENYRNKTPKISCRSQLQNVSFLNTNDVLSNKSE